MVGAAFNNITAGTLCLGCTDPAFIANGTDIEFWPLRENRPSLGDWQTQNVTVWVSGKPNVTAAAFDAVIDTTLFGIYAPLAAVQEIYALVNGSQWPYPNERGDIQYSFPCNSTPVLAFQWSGGASWSIPSDE